MRTLVIMRGAPGSGKSTFIRERGWQPYTLEPDAMRLQRRTPVMQADGTLEIPGTNDREVWDEVKDLLERRMAAGAFTVIDATHTTPGSLRDYRKLASTYKYRLYCIDFSDIPEEELLRRNATRGFRRVPEAVIHSMVARLKENGVSSAITRLRPEEWGQVLYTPRDLSAYRRVLHIGDIHGCYAALRALLPEASPQEDTFYIFVGDLFDRGTQNVEVLQFLSPWFAAPNVVLLEGNHERWLRAYAEYEPTPAPVFEAHTRPELEAAGFPRDLALSLYRRAGQCCQYTYHGRSVFVCHGGVPHLMENPVYLDTSLLIHGAGGYHRAQETALAWDSLMPADSYLVHGHRNKQGIAVQASGRVFNLEGQVEYGGHLRAVELTDAGFHPIETPNPVPPPDWLVQQQAAREERLAQQERRRAERAAGAPTPPRQERRAEDVVHPEVAQAIDALRDNPLVRETAFGEVSSFNFTTRAFTHGLWDEQTLTARGLFINTVSCEVVARAYNKFFNLDERPETRYSALRENLRFPVTAYVKENGFLGIVGYDRRQQQIIVTSKGDWRGEFAKLFQRVLAECADMEALENYVRGSGTSLVFEVIDPVNDPHIIRYDKAHVVLLDEVANALDFRHADYNALCALGAKLGLPVKERAAVLQDYAEWDAFVKEASAPAYLYQGRHIEGFVFEDAAGFMVKLKGRYYRYWKQMRSLVGALVSRKRTGISIRSNDSPFFHWVFHYLKNTPTAPHDIISLRELYAASFPLVGGFPAVEPGQARRGEAGDM